MQPKTLNLNDAVSELALMLRRLIGANINLILELDPEAGLVKATVGGETSFRTLTDSLVVAALPAESMA